jgi:hypothetical protein
VKETAQPVAPGTELPTIESEAYGYRFVNKSGTQVGGDLRTMKWTADYLYDEALDPELAKHAV